MADSIAEWARFTPARAAVVALALVLTLAGWGWSWGVTQYRLDHKSALIASLTNTVDAQQRTIDSQAGRMDLLNQRLSVAEAVQSQRDADVRAQVAEAIAVTIRVARLEERLEHRLADISRQLAAINEQLRRPPWRTEEDPS